MPSYPAGLFTPRTVANRTGISYDAAKTKVFYAEDINLATDEIVAIQETLGLSPEGAFTSVVDRLDDIDTNFSNLGIVATQRKSAVQSIPNVTVTKLTTNVADKTSGNITNDTTNSKIIIGVAGYYMIQIYYAFADNTGGKYRIGNIYKNNAYLIDFYNTKDAVIGGGRWTETHFAQLAVNDYIHMGVYHDAGGSLNSLGGCSFTVMRISD